MKRKYLMIGIFSFWILFACLSVGYNLINTFSEVTNWGGLSETQKKQKIFGNVYDFLIFIQKKTVGAKEVLIFSKDVKIHYLSMYVLYPVRVTHTQDSQHLQKLADTRRYTFIGTDDYQLRHPSYVEIAVITAKNGKKIGYLYKKK